METIQSNNKPEPRKWGLMELLAMTAGMMPVFGTIRALRDSGGGFLGYLLGVPSAIVIGIAILWTEAKLATALVIRAKDRSKKIKNVVGLSLLLFSCVGLSSAARLGFGLRLLFPSS
jgi:hypothetical protein